MQMGQETQTSCYWQGLGKGEEQTIVGEEGRWLVTVTPNLYQGITTTAELQYFSLYKAFHIESYRTEGSLL